jgi:hypothetical protein
MTRWDRPRRMQLYLMKRGTQTRMLHQIESRIQFPRRPSPRQRPPLCRGLKIQLRQRL